MTWKHVAVYWIGFLSLLAYDGYTQAPQQVPAGPRIQTSLMQLKSADIDAIALRRGSRRLSFERNPAGGWQSIEGGAGVTSGLLDSLAEALGSARAVAVVAPNYVADPAFGLVAPRSEIELRSRDGRRVNVATGSANPAGTAVYARVDRDPRVFLIGLDVRYYEDLLFAGDGTPAESGRGD